VVFVPSLAASGQQQSHPIESTSEHWGLGRQGLRKQHQLGRRG
jgi:hypothetical protein